MLADLSICIYMYYNVVVRECNIPFTGLYGVGKSSLDKVWSVVEILIPLHSRQKIYSLVKEKREFHT